MGSTERSRSALAFLPLLLLCLCFVATPPVVAQEAEASVADETTTRTYYVAAEQVTWDYAPSGADRLTGARFDTTTTRYGNPAETAFLRYAMVVDRDYAPGIPGVQDGIGRVYEKVLYREYTDSTFTERADRAPKWEHLGMLGPVLRAEVGDTIRVVFRNRAHRPYSMHPHGVSYEKGSEGKAYRDGTPPGPETDDAVPPGGTHTYVWPVPERAGPTADQPSSVLWMYHSHVREDEDINTGLVGPLIVTRRGMAGPDGAPEDVDREFVTMFMEIHEENSWLYRENVRRYTDLPVDSATAQPLFDNLNWMEAVNGYVFGNVPTMTMREGERVRWYVFTGPNHEDNHTIHWHANTTTYRGRRTDMVDMGPMMMGVADMVPDNPGTWLYHCHVDVHFKAGMSALYEVLPAEGDPETATRGANGSGGETDADASDRGGSR